MNEHRFDLPDGGTVTANLNAHFSSAYWLAPEFTSVERASAYATADALLSYRPMGRHWTLTGYVKNFTNQASYTGGTQDPIAAPLFAATINPPRTYGGRIRYEF